MRFGKRPKRALPRVTVVVPVYDVERWLPESLDSLLGQSGVDLEVVVVDDGSPDGSGAIADEYAARDHRVRVVHVPNGGLGSARNVGTEGVTGDFLGFLDSDDVVPPGALATLASTLEESGSDFVTGWIVRWQADGLHEPPWMRRLHRERRLGVTAREHPEILGDVFAWDKLFRRSFWDAAGLAWPEGIHYATFRLPDGVSFMHVVIDSDQPGRILGELPAFKAFSGTIEERCDEPPVATELTLVGSYAVRP